MNNIQEFVQKYQKMLPVGTSLSVSEAERRSGEFLLALTTLADWKHAFTIDRIEALTMLNATYAQQLSLCTGKTVTENKVTVEASAPYVEARERFEKVENDISYLKAYQDIFKDAHIFYRSLAKGDNAY